MEPNISSIKQGIAYAPEVFSDRQVRAEAREERIRKAGLVSVQSMSSEEISQVQSYLNGALRDIDRLRYPDILPDLKASEAYASSGSIDQYKQMAMNMARTVGADGREMPLNANQCQIMAEALSRYDMKTLQNLQRAGIKIRIYDQDNPPPTGFPGNHYSWDPDTNAYYQFDDKTICLKEESFRKGKREDTVGFVCHELSHAVDDIMYPDIGDRTIFATDRDLELQQLYQNYLQRVKNDPRTEWSDYARSSSREYFAEAAEYYMKNASTRREFLQKDPQMYAYLERKLRESLAGSLPVDRLVEYPGIYTRYPFNRPVEYPSTFGRKFIPFPECLYPSNSNMYSIPQNFSMNQIIFYIMMMNMMRMQQMMALMMGMSMSNCPCY